MSGKRRALILVFSDARNDPRVRRQIEWLAGDDWVVDTLGFGTHPDPAARAHYGLQPQAKWVTSRLGSAVIYGLLPHRTQFRLLASNRIPAALRQRIHDGAYDLFVFEDTDFIPLIGDPRVFSATALRGFVHLDLHEVHEAKPRSGSGWQRLTSGYKSWVRSVIGDARFTSRTTVANGIADLYAAEFGFATPAVVRNCPPYVDQAVGEVDPGNLKLLFHGLASRARGLREIIDALRHLSDRFSATFMLTGNPETISELRDYGRDLGDRLQIVPPVPVTEISTTINKFDLEIMFYPPVNKNVIFALPNKFFEAVQGRLGLVIGESPMMAELVNRYGNGIIIEGWEASDLAGALESLTPDRIAEFKRASHDATQELNAAAEGAVFLDAIHRASSRDHGEGR